MSSMLWQVMKLGHMVLCCQSTPVIESTDVTSNGTHYKTNYLGEQFVHFTVHALRQFACLATVVVLVTEKEITKQRIMEKRL